MVQRITGYKTEDGQFFEYQGAAKRHEAELELNKFLTDRGYPETGGWDRENLRDFLLDNADKIRSILLGASVDEAEAED